MSDTHEEAHTGPIKNPRQLLLAVLLSFVIPVFVIIGLVNFVGASNKVGAGTGMQELAQAQRIQKVGSVDIRVNDPNRPLAAGADVYKAQCAACHATGMAGAPKFEDAGAWGPRLGQGFAALVEAALQGKGAMAPQAGGQFNDTEIARGVAFMANAAGGQFEEPAAPSAATEGAAPAQ